MPLQNIQTPLISKMLSSIIEEDWRDSRISQTEQYLYMLQNELRTDVTFVVGVDTIKVFHCNRFPLARASPVFDFLLYNQNSFIPMNQIPVKDFEPETFQVLLEFIYTDHVELRNVDEALSLYSAANRYDMNNLCLICASYICSNLNPDNFWPALDLAIASLKPDFKNTLLQFLQENASFCLQSPLCRHVSRNAFTLVLEQDKLNIISEMNLITAAVEWGSEEAERFYGNRTLFKKALGPALFSLLRFLTLSPIHFSLPIFSKLFNDQEKLSVLCNINHPGRMKLASTICSNTQSRVLYKNQQSVSNQPVIQGPIQQPIHNESAIRVTIKSVAQKSIQQPMPNQSVSHESIQQPMTNQSVIPKSIQQPIPNQSAIKNPMPNPYVFKKSIQQPMLANQSDQSVIQKSTQQPMANQSVIPKSIQQPMPNQSVIQKSIQHPMLANQCDQSVIQKSTQQPMANQSVIPKSIQQPMPNQSVIQKSIQQPMPANQSVIQKSTQQPMANQSVIPKSIQQPMPNQSVIPKSIQQPIPNQSAIKNPMPNPYVFKKSIQQPMLANQSVIQKSTQQPMANQSVIPKSIQQPMPNQSVIPKSIQQPIPNQSAIKNPMPNPYVFKKSIQQPMLANQSVIQKSTQQPMANQSVIPKSIQQPMPNQSVIPKSIQQPIPNQSAIKNPMPNPYVFKKSIQQPMPNQSVIPKSIQHPMPIPFLPQQSIRPAILEPTCRPVLQQMQTGFVPIALPSSSWRENQRIIRLPYSPQQQSTSPARHQVFKPPPKQITGILTRPLINTLDQSDFVRRNFTGNNSGSKSVASKHDVTPTNIAEKLNIESQMNKETTQTLNIESIMEKLTTSEGDKPESPAKWGINCFKMTRSVLNKRCPFLGTSPVIAAVDFQINEDSTLIGIQVKSQNSSDTNLNESYLEDIKVRLKLKSPEEASDPMIARVFHFTEMAKFNQPISIDIDSVHLKKDTVYTIFVYYNASDYIYVSKSRKTSVQRNNFLLTILRENAAGGALIHTFVFKH